jgi:uncharacterized FlaG/YvyC family protein
MIPWCAAVRSRARQRVNLMTMSIQSVWQLENTRKKLQMVEARLRELDAEPVSDSRARDLTRRSLKKLINQLKEEIARFESHVPSRSDST